MEENQLNKFWGYIHINGNIQVKRYCDGMDLSEARESVFVDHIIEPFDALDREDALSYIRNKIN